MNQAIDYRALGWSEELVRAVELISQRVAAGAITSSNVVTFATNGLNDAQDVLLCGAPAGSETVKIELP